MDVVLQQRAFREAPSGPRPLGGGEGVSWTRWEGGSHDCESFHACLHVLRLFDSSGRGGSCA